MDGLDLTVLDRHPKNAVKLFKVMMRLEYALKELGFTSTSQNGNVKVNWERFSNKCLTSVFYEKIEECKIAKTLFAKPPSHQREESGAISFVDATRPSDVQSLIGAVFRVRNNLFHGGKSGDKDQDRNEELINDALSVLCEAIKSCDKLHATFEGRY